MRRGAPDAVPHAGSARGGGRRSAARARRSEAAAGAGGAAAAREQGGFARAADRGGLGRERAEDCGRDAAGVRARASAGARQRADRDPRRRLPPARGARRARPRAVRAAASRGRARRSSRSARARRRTTSTPPWLCGADRRWPDLGDAGEGALAARELEERRLEALELRNEAQLALGRHELVLPGSSGRSPSTVPRAAARAADPGALPGGRQTEALEAYRQARNVWVEELGVEPTPALQELERAILRHDPALAAPARPRSRSRRCRRRRRRSSAAGSRRPPSPRCCARTARLVTLVGPGGTGKTRVALAVAAELARRMRDGGAFVDPPPHGSCAARADDRARARRPTSRGRAVDALCEHLRERAALLVLDNFEQLLRRRRRCRSSSPPRRGCGSSPRAARRCGSRASTATRCRRCRCRRAGATAPDDWRERGRRALRRARTSRRSGVRARRRRTAPDVAEICRRLDGLPLAIELAAARAALLRPAELLARLERRPGAPRRAGRATCPRASATLRATIAWSYDLLGDGGTGRCSPASRSSPAAARRRPPSASAASTSTRSPR